MRQNVSKIQASRMWEQQKYRRDVRLVGDRSENPRQPCTPQPVEGLLRTALSKQFATRLCR
jgi:hypothetical protein